MKTERVRAIARVGLAVLAALVSPAILRAQGEVPGAATTSPGATPADVMAAASVAIPALKADSALSSALIAQYEKSILDTRGQLAALNARIKEREAELDKLKAEMAQSKEVLASLEAQAKELKELLDKLRTQMAEVLALIESAEKRRQQFVERVTDETSSLRLMRMVSADRAAASKLLEAMKQRNAYSLGTLLDPGASPASIVSVEVLSPAAIKMIFKVGTLTQCVATRPHCGTTTYAIVK